jgi:L-fuconolactonase
MSSSTASPATAATSPAPRLDAHQHFWRFDARQYPWMPAGSALQRDWLPADLARLQRPLAFDGSIAVQARQTLAETHWLLGLADADERIRGVVGWVDLRAEDVGDQLEQLARHPKLVGVRHVVQDEPDDAFMLGLEFQRGIGWLQEFGLTYDLLIYPRQLPAAIELVRRFPDQPFVLDHIAKPEIRRGEFLVWAAHLRELARLPNVTCKVSGMVTEADPVAWKAGDFRPYLDLVFEVLGPRRLMFGSDWPVCLLVASYEQVEGLVRDHVRGLGAEDAAAFWGGTASAFYGC